MPYNHPIPDAPIAPSMLPRVAAADLTSQDVLILTQPGNNPGEKNKGLELGALFEAMRSSLPTDTLLVDKQDENPSRYLISKFKGNSAAAYLDEGDVGFRVVSIRGSRFIVGVIENQAVTTDKLADEAVTNEKIAANAVSSGSLANNSVSTSKLIDSNVTTAKLANKAVTRAKIADNAVGAAQLDETESYNMAGLTITGANKSITMTEQAPAGAPQGIVMADGVIDHGYQLLTATEATYDLTSNYGAGDDSYITHIVALYNAYSGQCTVTIDSPSSGAAHKTVLLNSGNVGLFMKIGGNGVSPVFAPVSFSRTVNS